MSGILYPCPVPGCKGKVNIKDSVPLSVEHSSHGMVYCLNCHQVFRFEDNGVGKYELNSVVWKAEFGPFLFSPVFYKNGKLVTGQYPAKQKRSKKR